MQDVEQELMRVEADLESHKFDESHDLTDPEELKQFKKLCQQRIRQFADLLKALTPIGTKITNKLEAYDMKDQKEKFDRVHRAISAGSSLARLMIQDKASSQDQQQLQESINTLSQFQIQVAFPYRVRSLKAQVAHANTFNDPGTMCKLLSEHGGLLIGLRESGMPDRDVEELCMGMVEHQADTLLRGCTTNDLLNNGPSKLRLASMLSAVSSTLEPSLPKPLKASKGTQGTQFWSMSL